MPKILADISRAFAGSEEFLLQHLSSAFSREPIELFAICFEPQRELVLRRFPAANVRELPFGSQYPEVVNACREVIESLRPELGAENPLFVLSFHGNVLMMQQE
jgi:hypothetical protein